MATLATFDSWHLWKWFLHKVLTVWWSDQALTTDTPWRARPNCRAQVMPMLNLWSSLVVMAMKTSAPQACLRWQAEKTQPITSCCGMCEVLLSHVVVLFLFNLSAQLSQPGFIFLTSDVIPVKWILNYSCFLGVQTLYRDNVSIHICGNAF